MQSISHLEGALQVMDATMRAELLMDRVIVALAGVLGVSNTHKALAELRAFDDIRARILSDDDSRASEVVDRRVVPPYCAVVLSYTALTHFELWFQ